MAPNAPTLQGLPIEITVEIREHLQSVRDIVALDFALKDTQLLQRMPFDWKRLALEHVDNLLKDPTLCKQIQYDDNHKEDWNKRYITPSDWTRLPTTHTYVYWLSAPCSFPIQDLDGNKLNFGDVESFFQREQVNARWSLVFETKAQRTAGSYPSKSSRQGIGMTDNDTRNYAQLMQQTPPGSLLDKISECRLEDGHDHYDAVGQRDAYRKLFYQLITKNNSITAACMGCLASGSLTWRFVSNNGKGKVRFCEACLQGYVAVKGLAPIDNKDLTIFGSDCFELQRKRLR